MTRFITVATCVVVAACASAGSTQVRPSEAAFDRPSVHPGDAVKVQVWRESDLSGTFLVDDRGLVILPLVGETAVAGSSPDEIRDELVSRYRAYLLNPSVEVTILRRISILGEVRSPGLYPIDATVSLAEALAMAGGVTPAGDPNKIQLIRDGQVVASGIEETSVVAAEDIQSGDQLVVGEKSWIERNSGVLLGSLIAATAVIGAAFIR